jgi:Flp pilus assembly pilin Flp
MFERDGSSTVQKGSTMSRLMQQWSRLEPRFARQGGQSTVEYALVGALVVIVAAGAMALLGDQISSVFGHITSTLSGAAATAH